jgi:hypothetical protein
MRPAPQPPISNGNNNPPPKTPQQIALIFVAYDANGKEIVARVSGQGIAPHTTKNRSRLTREVGTVITLHFEPLDPRYGPARDERIEWQNKSTFDKWVNSEQSGIPSNLRQKLIQNSSDAAHDYPIIFKPSQSVIGSSHRGQ